jgi:transcriptional regulator with XRE-family HTH domain
MRSKYRVAQMPIDNETVCRELGRRIVAHRKNSKMTQSDLGNSIGTSFQQIQKYEDGKNQVSVCKLIQIAAALNVSEQELIDGLSCYLL